MLGAYFSARFFFVVAAGNGGEVGAYGGHKVTLKVLPPVHSNNNNNNNKGEVMRVRVASSEEDALNLTLRLRVDTSPFGDEYREMSWSRHGGFESRGVGVPQCLYAGGAHDVAGEAVGRVLASFCGSRARVWIRTLERRALEVRWVGSLRSHVVVSLEATTTTSLPVVTRGLATEFSGRREVRDWDECAFQPRKYVEIVAVNDASRYGAHGDETTALTALIMALVRDVYLAPSDDAYFGTLEEGFGLHDDARFACTVEPKLVGQVTFLSNPDAIAYEAGAKNCSACGDVCSRDDQISSTCLLDSFSAWVVGADLPRIFGVSIDNVQLFSGHHFDGNAIGTAFVSGMCSWSFSTGIHSHPSLSILSSAWVVAHEIGHNLGLVHDVGTAKFIMGSLPSASLVESGDMALFRFSNLSKVDANSYMNNVYRWIFPPCLDNEPGTYNNSSVASVCGNGVVEDGEECDVAIASVDDRCCGAPLSENACKLLGDCECAVSDPCCDDGRLAAEGTVCRVALHPECDFEERCDGLSPTCPIDLYVPAGASSCTDVVAEDVVESGLCFRADCMIASNDSYCGTEPNNQAQCRTEDTAASAGVPCNEYGISGQCRAAQYDVTKTGAITSSPAKCVDSSELRTYRWSNCACVGEDGNGVDSKLCETNVECALSTLQPSLSHQPTALRPDYRAGSTFVPTGMPIVVRHRENRSRSGAAIIAENATIVCKPSTQNFASVVPINYVVQVALVLCVLVLLFFMIRTWKGRRFKIELSWSSSSVRPADDLGEGNLNIPDDDGAETP
ncbi:hypothetical protein CTAYLR_003219 [Chrysophaeum taylorii]|uniref:Uncharacterized protein n=1 Tax=Chrysophaeum taylorii TaxID=2483200 RepID=A0AAD7UAA0_9STRA|nr:hypothetical protein CTAYLR_003219 [Chrysophaeum taylorii]